ncbi:MAG TPA: DUF885 domain-containing protein, partial [Gemmatimonadales bacterium]|nr:DUF885 domain-containing protein [Gemmatimonadales bacterium]
MHRRTFLRHTGEAAIAFGILRNLPACTSPGKAGASKADQAFLSLRDRYFLKALELNPVTATYLGGDGYDPSLAKINGRLRDYRPPALSDEAALYQGIRKELEAIDPTQLTSVSRVDHQVMTAQLRFMLHQLEDLKQYQRAIDTYVAEPFRGVDWQIQGMSGGAEGSPELGTEEEWGRVVERVRAIPPYLEVAKANLEAGKAAGNLPDHRMVERDGINGSKANAEYFRSTLHTSAQNFLGSRPFAAAVLGDLESSGRQAADAWEDFAAFLLKTYDPQDVSDHFSAGEKEYQWRLENVLQEKRTAAQLWDYGLEQTTLYENKIFDVAQEVAKEAGLSVPFSTDAEKRDGIRAVMEYLSKDSPKNDDELLQWYIDAGKRAVEYGRAQRLFDIPQDYRLDVTPTPPVLRSTIDAAYYPAPPFKKTGVGRFYLTPTGNDPAALKLNNRASVADTAVHEGFPGHDWHYKYMNQHAAEISNVRWFTAGAVEDSSAMWLDSQSTEGWGLYSEELMAEPVEGRPHGFYTAAEHLYELQGQLLRAVRVRVDTGLHTGRMSFADAIDYFTEHVSFYPKAAAAVARDAKAKAIVEGATRAIYRYSKWPTQAITYNLGKNAILALREQVRQKEGDKFSAREFHERFMRQGPVPVGYMA